MPSSAEYMKEYREKNKEKIAARMKEYRERNKEKISEQVKEYRERNKEKKATYMKEFDQTPKAKRAKTICVWKKRGLIHDDYDRLYDAYLDSTNCEECGIKYGTYGDGTQTFKCLDHDHQNGYFRNFLCCSCNIGRG